MRAEAWLARAGNNAAETITGTPTLSVRQFVEPTAIGNMTAMLERRGPVGIRRSPAGKRSRIVQLTDEGRSVSGPATPLWREAQRRFEELAEADKLAVPWPGSLLWPATPFMLIGRAAKDSRRPGAHRGRCGP